MLATLTLTLAACGDRRSGAKLNANRQLPAAPACMNEVPVPKFTVGYDARVALAIRTNALIMANRNLRCSKNWYGTVQNGFGGAK